MAGVAPPITIGFVGCGRATATLHLPALATIPDVKVTGLADPHPAALEAAARRAPYAHQFADYRDLLAETSPDVVAVCTPPGEHAEIAIAALDAGKHVFVEKPLALTLEDCDRMIARAAAASMHAAVGYNTRAHRLAREARALIRAGDLGPIEVLRSVLTSSHAAVPEWRQTRARGGGVLFEMATHHFDLWHFLTGAEVVEVSALASAGRWEDETVVLNARLADDVLASLVLSQRTTQQNAIDIGGRNGSLAVSFYRFDGLETASLADVPGSVRSRIAGAARLLRELPKGIATMRRGGEWFQSYREEWRQFLHDVRTGEGTGASLADGRRALAVALAATEAASSGRSVPVEGMSARGVV
jgi:myo-inositol 2-dehydrogenase / D-chiro-inositol 1-dehydrogenase